MLHHNVFDEEADEVTLYICSVVFSELPSVSLEYIKKRLEFNNALLFIFHQEADDKTKDVAEKMKTQTAQETEKLSSTISVLQKKLSVALSQVS